MRFVCARPRLELGCERPFVGQSLARLPCIWYCCTKYRRWPSAQLATQGFNRFCCASSHLPRPPLRRGILGNAPCPNLVPEWKLGMCACPPSLGWGPVSSAIAPMDRSTWRPYSMGMVRLQACVPGIVSPRVALVFRPCLGTARAVLPLRRKGGAPHRGQGLPLLRPMGLRLPVWHHAWRNCVASDSSCSFVPSVCASALLRIGTWPKPCLAPWVRSPGVATQRHLAVARSSAQTDGRLSRFEGEGGGQGQRSLGQGIAEHSHGARQRWASATTQIFVASMGPQRHQRRC